MKALPTLLLASGLLGYRWLRGQSSWPGRQVMGLLVVSGLVAQVLGNVLFQYSLGIVGIALSVPLTFGTLIVSGALAGRIWLGEPITPRATAAMAVLILSIVILSTGAKAAEQVVESESAVARSAWHVAWGVAAACMSGFAYGLLGVALRRAVSAKTPTGTTLFVISGTGVVSLGLCSLVRLGWTGLTETPSVDLSYMWWGGVFNAMAFMVLIQALKLAPLVHVNAVNSSQTALAAVAGILIFAEPFTLTLAVGVAFTMAGLLLLDHSQQTSDGQ
jgi:drug/metabolite transporter (DMT)-like permease